MIRRALAKFGRRVGGGIKTSKNLSHGQSFGARITSGIKRLFGRK